MFWHIASTTACLVGELDVDRLLFFPERAQLIIADPEEFLPRFQALIEIAVPGFIVKLHPRINADALRMITQEQAHFRPPFCTP
jgi:hypothetical protein